VRHDWPTLEFIRNATRQKMVAVGLADFVVQQVLVMNPAALPVWLAGLLYALFARSGRDVRLFGIAYLVALLILVASGSSRASYLAPAYPMLLAPGAVRLASVLGWRSLGLIRTALVVLMLALGALLLPFALPVLGPEAFLRYSRALRITPPQEERLERAELPQPYADMFGGEEMAATVARVYRSLPPEEQAKCVVFGQNYGEAGAIDVLGRRLGLPRALSGHNSYWLWGPGDWSGEVMIVLGGDPEDNAQFFERIEQVATVRCRWCMPYERDLPVYVGRKFKLPVAQAWARLKMYI
jgi:hypothetical protein